MTAEPPKIGLRVRRARERLRMTQQQLADVLGVARPTISQWETDSAYPQSSIGAIEDVLDIDLSQPDDPPPELIRRYGHIPEVAAIWGIPDEKMGELQRLGVIRLWLRENPPPENGPIERTA